MCTGIGEGLLIASAIASAGVGAAGAAGAFRKKGGGIELPLPPPAVDPTPEAGMSAAARLAADQDARRRGRSSLIVNPNGPLGGTGLNIPT